MTFKQIHINVISTIGFILSIILEVYGVNEHRMDVALIGLLFALINMKGMLPIIKE